VVAWLATAYAGRHLVTGNVGLAPRWAPRLCSDGRNGVFSVLSLSITCSLAEKNCSALRRHRRSKRLAFSAGAAHIAPAFLYLAISPARCATRSSRAALRFAGEQQTLLALTRDRRHIIAWRAEFWAITSSPAALAKHLEQADDKRQTSLCIC